MPAEFSPKMLRSSPGAPRTKAFRLLDLPGELRNMIYEHALTYEHGLLSTEYPKLYANEKGPLLLATPNQLRLVCRQLRTETRELALELSESFTFMGASGVTGFDTFLAFLPTLRSPLCKNLSRISICSDALCTADEHTLMEPPSKLFLDPDFAQLEAFCQQNPAIRVQVCFSQRPASVQAQYHSHLKLSAIMKSLRNLPARRLQPLDIDLAALECISVIVRDVVAEMIATTFRAELRLLGYTRIPSANLRVSLSVDGKRDCGQDHLDGEICNECWVRRCPLHRCDCAQKLMELTQMYVDEY